MHTTIGMGGGGVAGSCWDIQDQLSVDRPPQACVDQGEGGRERSSIEEEGKK